MFWLQRTNCIGMVLYSQSQKSEEIKTPFSEPVSKTGQIHQNRHEIDPRSEAVLVELV